MKPGFTILHVRASDPSRVSFFSNRLATARVPHLIPSRKALPHAPYAMRMLKSGTHMTISVGCNEYLLWRSANRVQNRASAKISRCANSTANSRAQPTRDRKRSRTGETHRAMSLRGGSRFLEALEIKKKQRGIYKAPIFYAFAEESRITRF